MCQMPGSVNCLGLLCFLTIRHAFRIAWHQHLRSIASMPRLSALPPASCACVSQRSLQDAPIFRLLLKVAVKGTHQCDFFNFWGSLGLPTRRWQQERAWPTRPTDSGGARTRAATRSPWRLTDVTCRLRLPKHRRTHDPVAGNAVGNRICKLTWLVLGEDPAARSHRVEQFTAL